MHCESSVGGSWGKNPSRKKARGSRADITSRRCSTTSANCCRHRRRQGKAFQYPRGLQPGSVGPSRCRRGNPAPLGMRPQFQTFPPVPGPQSHTLPLHPLRPSGLPRRASRRGSLLPRPADPTARPPPPPSPAPRGHAARPPTRLFTSPNPSKSRPLRHPKRAARDLATIWRGGRRRRERARRRHARIAGAQRCS